MKRKMYATVRRYEGVPDPASAAKRVDEKFVPFISSLPGFVEYYWIDLRDGAMISITVFKTLADAIHANEKARIFVKEHLSSVLPNPPRIEAGTIVAYKASS
ncbi:MAG TPA: hypothetical protein VEI46_08775 [Thermodesulfovibrionales bacterium]|nr:hypothetical protein [Thermodesulfovibrionales bacterium]